ncbi:MAG: hypothetical protein H0T53_03255 [Herpetosiphonaceae bacterium]|nr:hypothetical protein [Herpetosiphonaceae bacterium]
MSRRNWTLRLMLVVVLSWTVVMPNGAAARPAQQLSGFGCSSSSDPWFVETLAFDLTTIAPGVVVEPTDPSMSNALAQLRNASTTPLYLVELQFYAKKINTAAVPIVLADHTFVGSKVISDTVFTWTIDRERNEASWRKYDESQKITVSHDSLATVLAGYTDHQVFGDQRPLTVTMPLPQVYTLQVIYGTELISIPVTQTYTLNATYNPTRLQDEQAACEGWGQGFGISLLKWLLGYVFRAVIAAIIVVVLVVGLVSWILGRNKA